MDISRIPNNVGSNELISLQLEQEPPSIKEEEAAAYCVISRSEEEEMWMIRLLLIFHTGLNFITTTTDLAALAIGYIGKSEKVKNDVCFILPILRSAIQV
jgi:hypothetical protein